MGRPNTWSKLCRLPPAASVVFYTDGVVEAVNRRGEMFGFERLLQTLGAAQDLVPRELVNHIVETVQDFVGTEAQSDDITVVVLRHGLPVLRPSGSWSDGATGSDAGEVARLVDTQRPVLAGRQAMNNRFLDGDEESL